MVGAINLQETRTNLQTRNTANCSYTATAYICSSDTTAIYMKQMLVSASEGIPWLGQNLTACPYCESITFVVSVFPVPAGPAGAPPIDIPRAWARVM